MRVGNLCSDGWLVRKASPHQILIWLLALAAPALASNPPTDSPDPVPDFAFTGADCRDCLGADLELIATDEETIISRGATAVYTLVFTHSGADVASGVVVTATVPEFTSFDENDSTEGWERVEGTRDFIYDLFDLDPGETGSLRFAVTASLDAPVGELAVFVANIGDDGFHGPDKTPGNNTATDSNLITRGPTFVCGTIDVDTLWERLDGPFIVTCDIEIPSGVTLGLEPGTVVRFNSETGIEASGTLTALGSEAQPLIFTSNSRRSSRGDWDGIDVFAGGQADFEHVRLEYGGSTTDSFDALIYVAEGGRGSVVRSTLSLSDEYGVWSADGNVVVEDSVLSDNDNHGVRLQSSSPGNTSRVVGNTFTRNGNHPISLEYASGSTAEVRDNAGSDNAINAVVASGTTGGAVNWSVNADLPYVINADLIVGAGSSLTIAAGGIVKFEQASSELLVDGTLVAVGTEASPVAFTSIRDDAFGGDTNGDGDGSTPDPGDWGRIHFRPGSTGHDLSHFVVAYGSGASNFGQVQSDVPDLAVAECVFRDSRSVGLYLPGGAREVRHCRFENNASSGLHATLTGTRDLLLESNTLVSNGSHAMVLKWVGVTGGVTFIGNAATGNLTDGVAVEGDVGGEFLVDASAQLNFPLRLTADLTVSVDGRLTLSRGTILKVAAVGHDLQVFGSLIAQGTAEQPVVVTSFADDRHGGDTNRDGPSIGSPGDWGQIWFHDTSTGNVIEHSVVAFGGAININGIVANVRTDSAGLTVIESTLEGSKQHGLYAFEVPAQLSGVTFSGNLGSGAFFDDLTSPSLLEIAGNTFLDNVGRGLAFDDLRGAVDLRITDNRFEGMAAAAGSLDLIDLSGQILLSGNVAFGNAVNGVDLQGSVAGALSVDLSQQASLPLRLVGDLDVATDATLTLSAGTIVKAVGGGLDLDVEGRLIAAGTPDQPIVFTSTHDDRFGGDTLGDGDATAPSPGDWGQIYFQAGSTGNVLDHSVVAYGGAVNITGTLANVRADTDQVEITDTTLEHSRQYGLYALGAFDLADTTVHASVFSGVFFDNLTGSNSFTFDGNSFTDNGGHAVFLDLDGVAGQITARGNTASGNAVNGVSIQGSTSGDLGLDWSEQADLAIRLHTDFTVSSGTTLTLSPGVILKPAGGGIDLQVAGSLSAVGTADQPIVVTSISDDSQGGDTNGDGADSSPAPGDWGQIYLQAGSTANVLDHCLLDYGGAINISSTEANLRADTSDVTLRRSTLRRSRQTGLYALGQTFDISETRFESNAGLGIWFDNLGPGVDTTLTGNHFVGNGDHAFFLDLIDATGQVTAVANTASGNLFNAVLLRGSMNGTFALDWSAQSDLALRLDQDVTVKTAATLTLSPGTVLKATEGGVDLQVAGSLMARGTAAQPIVFTSIQDDRFAGDTNGDTGLTSPSPGDWGQVFFHGTSTGNVLEHCVAAYGGAINITGTVANVRTETADLTFSECTFESSAQHGLYALAAPLPVIDNRFLNNLGSGLFFDDLTGATTPPAPLLVTRNTFTDNGQKGLIFDDLAGAIDLRVSDNRFESMGQAAGSLDLIGLSGQILFSGNTVLGNAINGVDVQGSVAGALDLDWSQQADLPLRLVGDLDVAAAAVLTLSPGTIVKSEGGGLDLKVDGRLIAAGTVAQPIIFTAFKDDRFGGDTNGDGAATAPAPGDWGQIYLRAGSSGSVLDHTVVAYGGAINITDTLANVRADTDQVQISNTTLEHSRQHGLYVDGFSFDLTRTVVHSSAATGVVFDDLRGNVSFTFDGNTFTDNIAHAVFLDLDGVDGQVTARGNAVSGNGINGVNIQGSTSGDLGLDWSGQTQLAIRLHTDFTVSSGTILTLSPGVIIKPSDGGRDLVVDGSLSAVGTAAQPIVFTSIHDDTQGGDTNGNGAGSSPSRGDWGQVYLRSGSTANVLDHCLLDYGGATNITNTEANLRADTHDVTLRRSTLRRSSQSGLYTRAQTFDISETSFESNAGLGIWFDNLGSGVDMTLTDNHFTDNGGHAFFLDLIGAAGQVTASGNTATGNVLDAVLLRGSMSGAFALDWSAQSDLALWLDEDVTVNSAATLTLSPGTVLKATSGGIDLKVAGSLVARGTAAQPIVFTSTRDDRFAGDTNGDGTSSSPAPGDWGQILLQSTSTGNVLEHCRVAHGGAINITGTVANLRTETADLSFTECTFEASRQHGLYALAVPLEVADNVFVNNLGSGVYFDDLTGATPPVPVSVTSNVFLNNGQSGLVFNDLAAAVDLQVTSNRFEDMGAAAASLDLINLSGQVLFGANVALGNGVNGVDLRGSVAGALTLDWSQQDDLPFRLVNDLDVATTAVLTLSPGTIIKGDGGGRDIDVDGSLIAIGTVAQPIVFTSIRDDRFGGDTNGDADATGPSRGEWGQIYFKTTSTGNVLDHCVVAYGGATNIGGTVANVRTDTAQLTLTHSTLEQSRQYGFYALRSDVDLTGNTLANNAFSGAFYENLVGDRSITFDGNTFTANGGHAVFLDLDSVGGQITARDNSAAGNAVNGVTLQGSTSDDLGLDWSGQVDLAIRLENDFTVSAGTVLTLSPGVILKPRTGGTDLQVFGTLSAVGTAAQPIVITSIHDDTQGGDTNGNGADTSPSPGQWGQVYLRPGSTGHVLDHCLLDYGGAINIGGTLANLRADTSDVSLRRSTVRRSRQSGIYALGQTFDISETIFESNAGLGIFFDNLGAGVDMTLTGNSFLGNGGHAFFLDLIDATGQVTAAGNTVSGNAVDAVLLRGSMNGAFELDWSAQSDLAFRLDQDFTVKAAATLTLSPGAVLKATAGNIDLQVAGSLVARGTAAQPIAFTSIHDDRFAGDSSGAGSATSPAPGNWGQIFFQGTSTGNVLEHCVVAYGGAINIGGTVGNVRIDTDQVTITSSVLENSRKAGLHVTATVTTAPPPITGNNIIGNATFGVQNVSSVVIDARGNWWGDASGPLHTVQNPAGLGDRVSDNVLFDPWEIAPLPLIPPPTLAPSAPALPAVTVRAEDVPEPDAPREIDTVAAADSEMPTDTAGESVAASESPRATSTFQAVAAREVLRPAPARPSAFLSATDIDGGTEPHDTSQEGSPPLPGGYFGTVTTDGEPVPKGTLISAWVNGVQCAEVPARLEGGDAVYVLNVPGDAVNTSQIEGGVPGDTVVFKIAGGEAEETSVWRDALLEELNLTSISEVDLVVTQDNGRDELEAGETVSYVLTIANQGIVTATGVVVSDVLPANAAFISASDGGAFDSGVVTWPPLDLMPDASLNRIVTVQISPALPAGVDDLTNTASAADDGTHGVDPQANNTSQDTDTVSAAPDLRVTASDGLDEVAPGTLLAFDVTLSNLGTQGATGVVLTTTLPGPVTFFAASDDGIETDGVVAWPPARLAAGESVTRSVTLRLDDPLSPAVLALSYTAAVADDGFNGPDLDLSDNETTETTPVIRRPDLLVPSLDDSTATVDFETLALSGDLLLELENRGNLDAPPFEVTVFEDADADGAWTPGIDTLLGQSTFGVPLLAGQRVPFVVPVSGSVAFRGSRLFAFIDSAEAILELDESNNTNDTGTACQALPTPESFDPVIETSWPDDDDNLTEPLSRETVSTPIVVQLTDDTGDGRIDENDVPDVVFVSSNLVNLALAPKFKLRAIRGDTGDSIFLVDPPISGFFTFFSLTGMAAGDIDGDGVAEILVHGISPPMAPFIGFSNHIIAYEHTGQLKWVSQGYILHPKGSLTNRDNPTLADLEGDGIPEIVVGGHVFNSNGSLRWAGAGGQAFQSAKNADLSDSGAISVVANLDLVGDQEIVAGNTAYRSDGSIYWQAPFEDGYPAIANFDADPHPEIVVVARGFVRLHEHDGTLVWGPVELPGTGEEAGGAPTVADFDADGEPEIGVAGSTLYTVFETDGTVKWQRNIQDGSSNMTGSTVFDLDGDGRFEVIYRDETALRIYRGEDGVVLFEDPFSSFTANEQPVVADVDRDGQAEIIVTSDLATEPDTDVPVRTLGVRVYGDAGGNWVGTRRIWNQHAYHVDNVRDDGTIPARPEFSWLTHNTFRAQVAPPGVSLIAADLTASRGRLDVSEFPDRLIVTARIGNAGGTFSPTGLPVAFYDGDPAAGGQLIGTTTLVSLRPGDFQDVSVVWEPPARVPGTVFIVADDDGTGTGSLNECEETNNIYTFVYDLSELGLFLEKTDGEDTARRGDEVTYTLEITNFFGGTASGVAVNDGLPEHTVFVSASDGGSESIPGEVTWPLFSLDPIETVTRTVTVRGERIGAGDGRDPHQHRHRDLRRRPRARSHP